MYRHARVLDKLVASEQHAQVFLRGIILGHFSNISVQELEGHIFKYFGTLEPQNHPEATETANRDPNTPKLRFFLGGHFGALSATHFCETRYLDCIFSNFLGHGILLCSLLLELLSYVTRARTNILLVSEHTLRETHMNLYPLLFLTQDLSVQAKPSHQDGAASLHARYNLGVAQLHSRVASATPDLVYTGSRTRHLHRQPYFS